jgi:hypothetical protein
MRRLHAIGFAGVVALIAVPTIAAASNAPKPAAGKWTVTVSGASTNPKGSFKIASDHKHVQSFTVPLTRSEGNVYGSCPSPLTGKLTLPRFELRDTGGRWYYGNISADGPVAHNVGAKLNGAPLAKVTLFVEFQSKSLGDSQIYIKSAGDLDCYYDLSFKP